MRSRFLRQRGVGHVRSPRDARGLRDARGAVMLEFVLVCGLLFLLLFAMVDAGLMLNAKLVLASAAREGVRRAAIEGGATEGAYSAVNQQLTLGTIDPAAADIEISPHTAHYGTIITVHITYRYAVTTPIVQAVFGEWVELSAEFSGRSEKVPR